MADEPGRQGPDPGAFPEPVLDPGQRAAQVHRDDQAKPAGTGEVQPDGPRPPPGQEPAEDRVRQEREVRADRGGDQDPVTHPAKGTDIRTYSGARVNPEEGIDAGTAGSGGSRPYGTLIPRV
jgi:hypothetical protein